eukprot:7175396-Prymnesium_polylepis.1
MVHVPDGWSAPAPSWEGRLDDQPCADGADVIVPPEVGKAELIRPSPDRRAAHHAAAMSLAGSLACALPLVVCGALTERARARHPRRWECELFFAGAPNYTLGRSSACGDPLHAAGWQRCYAQGLRSLVFEARRTPPAAPGQSSRPKLPAKAPGRCTCPTHHTAVCRLAPNAARQQPT